MKCLHVIIEGHHNRLEYLFDVPDEQVLELTFSYKSDGSNIIHWNLMYTDVIVEIVKTHNPVKDRYLIDKLFHLVCNADFAVNNLSVTIIYS